MPLVVSQRTVKDEEAESSATSARIVVCRRLMDADQSIQKRRMSVRKVICFSQFSQHVRVGGSVTDKSIILTMASSLHGRILDMGTMPVGPCTDLSHAMRAHR
jgi:hypothetical protein